MASQQPAFAGSDFSVPMSVEQITRMAQDYEYNPMIPLRYWLRSAASLLKEVGPRCCYIPSTCSSQCLMVSYLTGQYL